MTETGTMIDRFGREGGSFVSPQGVPFTQRAVAPGTSKSPNYIYEDLKPIDNVLEGRAAPWFGQPEGGFQYLFDRSIKELRDGGFIRKVIF